MKDILDQEEKIEQVNSTFSKISFAFAMLTLTSIIILFMQIPSTISGTHGIPRPPYWMVAIVYVFHFLGLAASIASLARKEQISLYKQIGVFLNFFILFFIVGLILFSRTV